MITFVMNEIMGTDIRRLPLTRDTGKDCIRGISSELMELS